MLRRFFALVFALIATIAFGSAVPAVLLAQATGTIEGRVTRPADGSAVSGVQVTVQGTAISAVSGIDGRYTLHRVPVGTQTVQFRLLGLQALDRQVSVMANATATLDAAMARAPVLLGEVVVSGVSRAPERVVEAPAAVTVVQPADARDVAVTGQLPRVLNNVAGVDVVQSGINDFNVNARGFNSSLNRRVLVLQDGRDLSIAFLGAQEWSATSLPADQFGRIEMVRGPGSALYGANAFSGVLNFTTPPARDVVGTSVTVAGGELSTMRGDLHHAGVLSRGRFGYRVNAGFYRSDSWSRSRTLLDGTSLQQEYGPVTDTAITLFREVRPLDGQTVDPATGEAQGDADPVQNIYGSARFDYYAANGSMITVDAGGAQAENDLFVTGIGRVQVTKALRPWARVSWAHDNYNVMAWYSGRDSRDPQYSLAAGLPLEEQSTILHVEGQYNRAFMADRARVVLGASARNYKVNTDNTLMAPADDDRSDKYLAGYGQLEYRPTPKLRLVAAGRVDDGDLFTTQFSPKGAVVYSPTPNHSIRLTVNQAFQTPNYSEFYLRAPAGAPTESPALLEAGLEQYFAAVLASAPGFAAGLNLEPLPWNFSAQTPVLALGNANLDVEKVTGWEVGYKGTLAERAFITLDLYFSRLRNFVTDLLPGVNPDYPTYLLTDDRDVPMTLATLDERMEAAGLPAAHPLRAPIPTLQGGYQQLDTQAGPLLATMPDGTRALAVSYTNAGLVKERGVEVGASYSVTDAIRLDGTYALFDFDVDETQTAAGDKLLPNTPKHRATGGVSYRGRQGVEVSASARFVSGFRWAAGVFEGWVPASQTVTASAGYSVSNNLRVHVTGTNILDQRRFYLYGGDVIGRRVIGGVTAVF